VWFAVTRIRLVAIDLDGTLLDNDLAISFRAKQAIRRAREQGVQVTLATGRMYASAVVYAEELDLDVPLITYQGALVKTSRSGEVLYRRHVPLALARQVIMEARDRGFHVNVYLDDRLYVEAMTGRARDYARIARVPLHPVGDLVEFIREDPTKVLVVAEEQKLDAWARECREFFGQDLYITKSLPHFLEFLHPEATKGRGLTAVAQALGIPPAEIMAIGDSFNDLEMFKFAGLAVAMGNARREIREAADYVTLANDDDGVAEALEKFVCSQTPPSHDLLPGDQY